MDQFLVRGGWIITDASKAAAGVIRDGAVYIAQGKIVQTGDYSTLREAYPQAQVLGSQNDIVMPGLIDAHSHGRGLSFVQRGIGFDFLENSLIDWSAAIDLPPELNAKMTTWRHMRNGCTTMHHNEMGRALDPTLYPRSVESLRTYQQSGMRVCYSPGIRDENFVAYNDEAFFSTLPEDLQQFAKPLIFYDKKQARREYFEVFDKLYSEFNHDQISIFLGPNWAHGSTDEYILETVEKSHSLGGLPIHIHTLQTPQQRAYGMQKYGKSLLQRLDDLGIVDEHFTLGHAVYLTEDDIALLGERHGNVTSHPSCNFSMRNGIAPLWFMHQAGVNIAIGIDEKAFADDEDIIAELRMLFDIHRLNGFELDQTAAFTPYDVLAMGTCNAAKTLGLQDKTGRLLPGMCADIITVDTENILRDPWASPDLDIAKAFIYRAKGTDVTNVMIDGKIIVSNGKCQTMDIDALYAEVREIAARGQNEAQKEYSRKFCMLKPYVQQWYKKTLPVFPRDPWYEVNSRH